MQTNLYLGLLTKYSILYSQKTGRKVFLESKIDDFSFIERNFDIDIALEINREILNDIIISSEIKIKFSELIENKLKERVILSRFDFEGFSYDTSSDFSTSQRPSIFYQVK